MKFFLLFLLFVTIWVIVICGFLYLSHRSAASAVGRRRRDADVSSRCCLEVPCSDDCAREHQRLRDLLTVRYGEVVHEIGKIVQAGRELEPASGLPDE